MMRKTKLYKALSGLDKTEHNRLRKLVASPYFNRSDEISQLLELILDDIIQHPQPQDDSLSKDHIWAKLQPGKRYDDTRFRKYSSDLYKLVEEYLLQQSLQKDKNLRLNLLAQGVMGRKIDDLTQSVHHQLLKDIESNPLRNTQFYYERYRTEKTIYYLLDLENRRGERANLEEMSESLDDFYLLEKLRLLILYQSRRLLKSFDYQISINNEILQLIETTGKLNNPSIAIYYQINLLYIEPENELHYFKLVALLEENKDIFPNNELKDELYTAAINYCLGRANRGDQRFLREYYNLSKSLVTSGVLIENGELSPWHFRNTVVAGLRLGEYDWVEALISDYSSYLPESFRRNAVTYNLAQLYFYQKKFDKVIEQLQNVEYDDVSYNLNSKSILLATYYELDEIDPLFSFMDAFKTYLSRQKSLPQRKIKDYLNLIRFTKRLVRILPGDTPNLEKLKQDILNEKGTVSASWLLEKISEME